MDVRYSQGFNKLTIMFECLTNVQLDVDNLKTKRNIKENYCIRKTEILSIHLTRHTRTG